MIALNHPKTKDVKLVPNGFSWTVLLFGPFVPLLRGDILWVFIILICALVTMGISSILFAFLYNNIYKNSLMNKGYKIS